MKSIKQKYRRRGSRSGSRSRLWSASGLRSGSWSMSGLMSWSWSLSGSRHGSWSRLNTLDRQYIPTNKKIVLSSETPFIPSINYYKTGNFITHFWSGERCIAKTITPFLTIYTGNETQKMVGIKLYMKEKEISHSGQFKIH